MDNTTDQLELYLSLTRKYVVSYVPDILEAQVVWDGRTQTMTMTIPATRGSSFNLRCYARLFSGSEDAYLARAIVLTERLRRGVAAFQYIKTDGTTRIAYGTLDTQIISKHQIESTPKKKEWTRKPYAEDGIFVYFDLEKLGWREFHISPGFQLIDSYIL